MSRTEFPKSVKRLALKRADGRCEARGKWYGLPDNKRCSASLANGVEFDHIILAANGGDASLDNCASVCIPCHRFKTSTRDTPLAAKTLRQQDKDRGIRKRSSRPFPRRADPWNRNKPNVKQLHDGE